MWKGWGRKPSKVNEQLWRFLPRGEERRYLKHKLRVIPEY